MKSLLIYSAILVSGTIAYAQNSNLKQAIKHYNLHNLGLAEKEIAEAIKDDFSSRQELGEAMFYYFMINADLYCTAEKLPMNLDRLARIADSYKISKRNDLHYEKDITLLHRANEIGSMLRQLADSKYSTEKYKEYFFVMDYFCLFMDAIGSNCGPHYQELAKTATSLAYDNLAVKYWYKAIESGHEKEEGYEMLLPLLNNLGKHKKVDELLTQAKSEFPESLAFAAIEIRRYLKRGMKFSALQLANSTIKKQPENTEIWYLLGLLNTQHDEHQEALQAFLTVVKMDPSHYEAHRELGRYYYRFGSREGNLHLSKKHLEKAYSIKPLDSSTFALLHEVYLESGDTKSAYNLSKRAGS